MLLGLSRVQSFHATGLRNGPLEQSLEPTVRKLTIVNTKTIINYTRYVIEFNMYQLHSSPCIMIYLFIYQSLYDLYILHFK